MAHIVCQLIDLSWKDWLQFASHPQICKIHDSSGDFLRCFVGLLSNFAESLHIVHIKHQKHSEKVPITRVDIVLW